MSSHRRRMDEVEAADATLSTAIFTPLSVRCQHLMTNFTTTASPVLTHTHTYSQTFTEIKAEQFTYARKERQRERVVEGGAGWRMDVLNEVRGIQLLLSCEDICRSVCICIAYVKEARISQ